MRLKFYFPLLSLLAWGLISCVEAQTLNQKGYDLFHPVPKQQMREMESDRPGVTESPYSVDAGHVQYETDIFYIEHEKLEEADQHTTIFNQGNLKLGVARNTEIQIGLETYVSQRNKLKDGSSSKGKGVGDLTVRIKQNLGGNDGGNFAIAVIPYLKFPTAKYTGDSKYEEGIIVPIMLELPGEWKIGSQIEADRLFNEDAHAMHTELLQSLTISHEIIKNLDGFAETNYRYDFNAQHWTNFLNASAQFKVSKDISLDAGVVYGLQSDAPKSYSVGTSLRF